MAHGTAAGSKGHAHPSYVAIFWWLTALTAVELSVPFLLQNAEGFALFVKASSLIGMAATKAVLVAMYFMHLRFESRTLAFIAGTPIVLCVFLMLMLLPDAFA